MIESRRQRDMSVEADEHKRHTRFIQSRLPSDMYEWLRLRGFLSRRSMNSIVLEAVGEYRTAIESGQATLSKESLGREAVVKYNVRVDDDLYEWLRTTAFYARLSINVLFVAALLRYREKHSDASMPSSAAQ